MLKRTILTLTVAALAFTGVAQAQENATLTLRSGDKVSGQLVDLGGVGFTVKVNGADRQIPTNDVAVIDFAGGSMTDADWAKVHDGTQTLVLRSGSTVDGQLFDIGGTTPLKISFKTSSGDREFSSNEIGRIILARPSNAVATTGATSAQLAPATGSGVVVSARQAWTSTAQTFKKGDVLTLSTTGEVQLSGDASDVANSTGSKTGRRATSAQMPAVPAGALLGRMGSTGQPFPLGNATTLTVPADGVLFLGINDDGFDDNQGEYRVAITRGAGTRRR
ncbi:MAG: hypothetical protein ABJC89_08170 [Acidobacteriota bacterium]